jgi:two-component system sensor histidine kinase VanS
MKKNLPLFTKIFAYTMLLLGTMSLAGIVLFARQFLLFYRSEQQRQFTSLFEPVFNQLEGKSPDEVAEIARTFYNKNQSFKFIIQGEDGKVLFSSPGVVEHDLEGDGPGRRVIMQFSRGPGQGYTLRGIGPGNDAVDYGDLMGRSFLALGIMLAIGVLGAVLFARRVTKPLEDELAREKVMEENQRLFFSAASHELKTPIAATRALVEGMMANIGDYKDHQKYLRECLKNLDSQNRLVSEILEMVTLTDEKAELFYQPLDPEEIVVSLLAASRPIAEQRGLNITTAFSGHRVRADRNLLCRALSNVISNAVQNTPENGSIRIKTEHAEGGCIRLTVLNTGNRISGRNGLGLTIVKKSLDRMGIPFALEDSSEGVLFRMDLPPG